MRIIRPGSLSLKEVSISLGRVLLIQGKLDGADAISRKAVNIQPTGTASRRWQVFVAAMRGDGDAVLREAQPEPNEPYRRFEVGLAYFVRSEQTEADAALARLIEKDRNVLAYQVALLSKDFSPGISKKLKSLFAL